jgi:hypothetical protein
MTERINLQGTWAMDVASVDEISDVLDRVKQWPSPSRLRLARLILESLDSFSPHEQGSTQLKDLSFRGIPVDQVVGFLKTDKEPPDDVECHRIIEEERWRKYGF